MGQPRRPSDPGAVDELARALGLTADHFANLLPSPVTVHWPNGRLGASWSEQADRPFGDQAVTWATAGAPVLVLVAADQIEVLVAEPQVVWDGQIPQLETARVVSHPIEAAGVREWLADAVSTTVADRLATFSTCEECGETQPPEWMMDDGELCQGCAERNYGVVF